MEGGIKKARYRVTHTLYSEKDYEAVSCVDVESREKTEYLINVYTGDAVRRYVGCYDRLSHCPAFHGIFLSDGALNAVFDLCGGKPIDEVFRRGAELDWHVRMQFAQELFHIGLSISDYPPEIACAALLSENLRVFQEEARMAVRYMVRPMDGMNQREEAFLLIDQAKKILLRRFSPPKKEINFLDELEENAFASPVALYALWNERKDAISKDYEALYAKPSLARVLYLTFQNIGRAAKRLLKKKKR